MKPTACRKERSVLKKLVLCAPTHYTFSTATVAISDILSKQENKQKTTTFNEARNG